MEHAVSEPEDNTRPQSPPAQPKPYRWGYFQGAVIIPFSLLMLLGVAVDLPKTHGEEWFFLVVSLLMGVLGLPLGVGLLYKRRYALALVYTVFALSALNAAVKIPIAVRHFTDPGYRGSAMGEAELLLVWLLSLVYYRKRTSQFH